MADELICPICNEHTRVYMGNARKDRLCGKHADELKKGNIIVNEEGLFVDSKTNKILNKDCKPKETIITKEVTNEPDETVSSNITGKCIACGKSTLNGHFFCNECYYKYKDKRLLIEIRKCVDFEILDDSYEGKYNCDDGHIVKSKSEWIIDNFLFEKGIPHAYEKAFPIDDNEKHDLHPDFFLPNYKNKGEDVYIEHWGYNENNIDYWKSKKYKIVKYKEKGITLICTNEKDMSDPKTALTRKLEYYKSGLINYDEVEQK